MLSNSSTIINHYNKISQYLIRNKISLIIINRCSNWEILRFKHHNLTLILHNLIRFSLDKIPIRMKLIKKINHLNHEKKSKNNYNEPFNMEK